MTEELTWETDLKSFTLLIILTLLQLSEKIIFHNAYILITFCKQNPAVATLLIYLTHVKHIFVTNCIDERSNTMKQC